MRKAILVMIGVQLTGCITLNESMLRVEKIQPEKKAMIFETKAGDFIQKINGEGDHRGVMANNTVATATTKLIMNRWKDHDLVADFGPAGELKGKPDYTFVLSGTRNEDMSWAGAVFSGLTLMLIPTTSTITTDAKVELTDNRTGKTYHAEAKNGFTTVIQILFFPAFPFGSVGSWHSFDDIADALYNDFKKQGAF